MNKAQLISLISFILCKLTNIFAIIFLFTSLAYPSYFSTAIGFLIAGVIFLITTFIFAALGYEKEQPC